MTQESRQSPKRAIVIGTGIGGAGIAALMARQGLHVTVFERSTLVGGKTACYTRDGFTMDIAIHASPRSENGPTGELIKKAGAELEWLHKEPVLRIILGTRVCRVRMKIRDPFTPLKILWKLRLSPLGIIKTSGFWLKLMKIKSPEDVRCYEGMPAEDLLQSGVKDKKIYEILSALASLMLVMPTEEASAADYMWSLASWLKEESSGYPRGGFGKIPQTLLGVCRENRGDVRISEPVDRIVVENGRVTGVETARGFYPADIVVSNAGIKKTVEMAGRDCFEKDFFDWVQNLKGSYGSVVVQYALDKKLADELVTLTVPDDFSIGKYLRHLEVGQVDPPSLFIVSPTVVDPAMAPAGRHILLAGVNTSSDLSQKDVAEKVLDKIEVLMRDIYPDIEKHTVWKVRRNIDFYAGIGGRDAAETIGLAQHYAQDGANKPNPALPVKGLYVVGADAGGNGIGTEMAADSAMNVFDIVMHDLAGI